MKATILTAIAVFCLLAPPSRAASGADKIGPSIIPASTNSDRTDSLINVIVFLEDGGLRASAASAAVSADMTRDRRIKAVYRALSSYQPNYEAKKAVELVRRYATGNVQNFWITPAVAATIPAGRLSELAAMDGVRFVAEDAPLIFDPPVERYAAPAAQGSSSQLQLLNVPTLWQQGLTGKGRLVCSFDTGVEGIHPALWDKWRGRHTAKSEAWFSPVYPDSLPLDRAGHGTHTMGIMVGSTPTDTFGVAFESEWITAGVIDQGRSFNTTMSDILNAFQWVLDPDGDPNTTDDVPDVILNSWGVPRTVFPNCNDLFFEAIDAVETAGIVTIFAAGNEGPDAGTIRNPADRATTPLNSFSVGAVDNNMVVAAFSSRGPSSCGGEIKPEVMAPGVAVWSSTKGGTYVYMSGTSMAAPYIAGLVALCRQYNPDATVEQIKTAFIQSARDLGAAGEDNAYGYGLVDASKLLDYLPAPVGHDISLQGVSVVNDDLVTPGERMDLRVTLTNASANVASAIGRLDVTAGGIDHMITDTASFFFGDGGTVATNLLPFSLLTDSSAVHGSEVNFVLRLEKPTGEYLDSVVFSLTIGYPQPGHSATINTGTIGFTISDFAQYGLAPGSIYNLDAAGFTAYGSQNLLYEAGLIIGRNSLQLSSSVRNSQGTFRPSDFTPRAGLSLAASAGGEASVYSARMVDLYGEITIPITVSQEVIHYTGTNDRGIVAMRYWLINDSLEKLSHLSFGFLADFDLPGGETAVLDESLGLLYTSNDADLFVGLLALEGIETFQALDNGAGKTGLTREQQYALISDTTSTVNSPTAGDLVTLISANLGDVETGDSVAVSFAIVTGRTLEELYTQAGIARMRFDVITSAGDDNDPALPDQFRLHQNYPNPFNPTTTISFSLPTAENVRLEIFNSLGRRVATLLEKELPAGEHSVVWDGSDGAGDRAASGVYFYRLVAGDRAESRKMILLK